MPNPLTELGSAVGALLKERKHTIAASESSAGGLINAALLAKTVRANLGATWGLSETGASGPSGNRYGDAPGHACIAVSGPVDAVITVETGSADREANMWEFARRALELLESCLHKTTFTPKGTP